MKIQKLESGEVLLRGRASSWDRAWLASKYAEKHTPHGFRLIGLRIFTRPPGRGRLLSLTLVFRAAVPAGMEPWAELRTLADLLVGIAREPGGDAANGATSSSTARGGGQF